MTARANPLAVLCCGLACVLLTCRTIPARAATGTGGFLRYRVSPAIAAQGGAGAGHSTGLTAWQANPAGLWGGQGHAVCLQYDAWQEAMHRYGAAVLYHTAQLNIAGGCDVFTDAASGWREGITTTDDALSAQLGLALPLTDGLDGGLTGRYIREDVAGSTCQTWSGDAGVMLHLDAQRAWTVGLAARNLGRPVAIGGINEELPLEYAVGTSFFVMPDKVRLSGEAVKPNHATVDYRVGLEVRPLPALAVRAGYRYSFARNEAFTAGLGVDYSPVGFDYAYADDDAAGASHQLMLRCAWGEPAAAAQSGPQPAAAARVNRQADMPVTAPQRPAATAATAVTEPEYTNPLRLNPAVERQLREGDDLLQNGQYLHAVQRYQRALELDHQNYRAYYKLGFVAYQMGQFASADQAFMCALVLRPDSVEALVNLGAAEYQLGSPATARQLWEKALLLDPECTIAKNNLAQLRQQGR